MRNFSMIFRFGVIVVIMVASLIAISGAQIWSLQQTIYAEREQKLRDMVGSVQNLIKNYDDEVKAGHLSLEQAQEAAKTSIRAMRWGNSDYFGVYQFDGVTLVHANPKNEGVNRMEFKDPKGRRVVAELIAAAQKGGRLVTYMVPRGGADANDLPLSKLSYAAPYEPWKWAIQTGVYIDDIEATLWRQFLWTGCSCLIVLLAVGISTMLIARGLTRRIDLLISGVRQVANGDLTVDIAVNGGDELGALARAAGEMRARLHDLAFAVRTRAQSVHSAALEIAGAVEGQAATSSEMSASVAEITSTMEELSASSTQIAEHSKSVVDIANTTYGNANRGSEAMQLVMSKMSDIQQDNQNSLREILDLGAKSKEISKVMTLINAVADQTKLIAFNAALEAASAGEAGRRFSVVAAEIRRLADSVTESTGEIETKISQIQDSISRLVITSEKGASGIAAGMDVAGHTAERLGDLVGAARQTSSAAQQISLSTQQQKTASNQVVVALREIVTASSQTAFSISRISEVSQDMTRLSTELDTLVGHFRLHAQTAPLAPFATP